MLMQVPDSVEDPYTPGELGRMLLETCVLGLTEGLLSNAAHAVRLSLTSSGLDDIYLVHELHLEF